MDKEANANGGMLVIATSVPDEREWIQWRGRTARQDRPGQFYVLLDRQQRPYKGLASKLSRMSDEERKIQMLLKVGDEGMGKRLKTFAEDQVRGEKLNQLAIAYYKAHSRSFDDQWPCEQHWESDVGMRAFLESSGFDILSFGSASSIAKKAKALFGLDI